MSNPSSAGSLNTALLAVFVTLKLTNHIDWSWWWVMSPMWIPLCMVLVFLAVWFSVKGLS